MKQRISRKHQQRLTALEEAAGAAGIEVSYDRLKYAGLILKSGLCTYKGRRIIFVESRKPPQEKIDILVDVLSSLDLSGVELSAEAAKLLSPMGARSGGL